jgi:hypothetical protein
MLNIKTPQPGLFVSQFGVIRTMIEKGRFAKWIQKSAGFHKKDECGRMTRVQCE